MENIILENDQFYLELSACAKAVSLVCKANGCQCLFADEQLPFFSLTEERPYNNEVKLALPTRRTTFGANRLRMENGKLIVGFEQLHFEAVVAVTIYPQYMVFERDTEQIVPMTAENMNTTERWEVTFFDVIGTFNGEMHWLKDAFRP